MTVRQKVVGYSAELTGALDAMRGVAAAPQRILLAQQRALGTLRRRLPTEAKRDIGAEYNLSPTRIAQGLSTRVTPDGLALTGSARGINAMAFGATWSPRMTGARFAIKRGGDRSSHDGSFIAVGRSGNRLVFERKGKARLPIQGVYGPSLGQMLKHGRRPERLVEFALRVLQSEQARLLGNP
jgi:Prophage minor tail protein Z (GPZ)